MSWLIASMFLWLLPAELTPLPLIQSEQQPVVDSKSPLLQIPLEFKVNHQMYDFKILYQGQSVTHDFILQNVSERAITITDSKSDCGCETVIAEKRNLQPGDETVIHCTFDPGHTNGPIEKKISIYTDLGPKNNVIELALKAEVQSVLLIQPGHIYFKNLNWGEESSEELSIKQIPDVQVKVIGTEVVEGPFTLAMEEVLPQAKESAPNDTPSENSPKQWKISLKLPSTTPIGRFAGKVRITTDFEAQKEIIIPVFGYVRGPISINPTQVYFGAIAPGEIKEKTLILSSKANAEISAPEVTSDVPGLSFQIEPRTEKQEYAIKLTLQPVMNSLGKISGLVTIKTLNENQPSFEVPIFAYIAAAIATPEPGSNP